MGCVSTVTQSIFHNRLCAPLVKEPGRESCSVRLHCDAHSSGSILFLKQDWKVCACIMCVLTC